MTYTEKDIKHLELMHSLAAKKDDWVVCEKCGEKDITKPGHTGTKAEMHCKECAGPAGTANKCRNCCPTGHGTRFETEASFDETILKLCSGLRDKGLTTYADTLEEKFITYKRAANVHLYRAHDEDGEDLINAAHPDSDPNMGDGDLGDVENLLTKHKKIVDVIKKEPSGKLGSYVEQCKVALGASFLALAQEKTENNYDAAKDAINKFRSVYNSISLEMGEQAGGNDQYFDMLKSILDRKETYKFKDFADDLTATMNNLKAAMEPSYLSLSHSAFSPEQEQKWQSIQKYFPILNKYADRFHNLIIQIQAAENKIQSTKESEEAKEADPEYEYNRLNTLLNRLNKYLPLVSKYNDATVFINNTIGEVKDLMEQAKQGTTPELDTSISNKENQVNEFATNWKLTGI
jgi:hypothetical protein